MSEYNSVEDFAADQGFQDFVLDKSVSKVQEWQRYLIDNPHKHDMVAEASAIIKTLSPGDIISVKRELSPNLPNGFNSRRFLAKFLLIAALLFSVLWSYHKFSGQNNLEVQATYATSDKVASFDLMDGSKVTLRPHSKLEILGDWDKSRICRLTGDAFLDVSPDKRKFIVTTENDKVTVLGTKFTITTHESYEIILVEGKVQHSSTYTNPVILRKNQKLSRVNSEVFVDEVDAWKYSLWTNDKLEFKDQKLINIVDILQKSYDILIDISNEELHSKVITAQVPVNDPELILKAIAEIYDIKLLTNNERYILK